MGKINVLSEHLSNMIAAGEVVERPSGIVKELVENSIDANARSITVHIVQGGIESITIIDDGEGMDAQDSTTAFERHATSKMKDENDLERRCLRLPPYRMSVCRPITERNLQRLKSATVSFWGLIRRPAR